MTFPENLKYTKEHEWVSIEEGIATVGITDFAQSELGDIVYVEIDMMDEEVAVDEVFGTIEAVKTTSELFMPLSGEIIEFNPKLDEDQGDEPALVNDDAYGDGWIIKIKLSDESEIEKLMSADEYAELVN